MNTSSTGRRGLGAWADAIRDPRLGRRHHIAFLLTSFFVLWATLRLGSGRWGQLFGHARLHLWVTAWLLLATIASRTTSWREAVRFWVVGLFPVVLVVFLVTESTEAIIGLRGFQTGFVVPLVEEVLKVVPLVLWVVVSMRRRVTPSISDLMVLGYAVGAGFAFHEDALWSRLAADGFGGAPWGLLFPTFLHESRFVVTHSGWTMLAGIGVGIWAVHRSHSWAWVLGTAFVALAVVDHAYANARGAMTAVLSILTFDGRLAGWLLLVGVPAVIAHDILILRWAGARSNRFPAPRFVDDLQQAAQLRTPVDLQRLLARQRYRRARSAAFIDLYRVRSRGVSAGDRRGVIAWLRGLEAAASAPR